MNRNFILYNLNEALEQLSSTIKELEANPDYHYGEFIVDTAHLYHHLNTAWNAQNASNEEVEECSEENFYKWRGFPEDIYMGK